jgi:2-amino-4-hydroxy-6-hydroxymethyldihydropteridine diphosphokinase
MTTAYIGLGSNLGKRQAAIRAALEKLAKLPSTRLAAVATFRETDPVDCPPGSGAYMNSVAAIHTDLSPAELLQHLLRIERELGRDRTNEQRNDPRVIDLDLLLIGDTVLQTPELELPHPRMWTRKFVLEPLAEIAPDLTDPITGTRVQDALARLST